MFSSFVVFFFSLGGFFLSLEYLPPSSLDGFNLVLIALLGMVVLNTKISHEVSDACLLIIQFLVWFFVFRFSLPGSLTSLTLSLVVASVLVAQITNGPKTRLVLKGFFALFVLALAWVRAYELDFAPIRYDCISAFLQADIFELISYSKKYFIVPVFLCPILSLLLFSFFRPATVSRHVAVNLLILVCFLLGLHSFPVINKKWSLFKESIKLFDDEVGRQQAALAALKRIPAGDTIAPKFKGSLIVVIGESTTRRHMSVYGYSRKTTPFLDSIRNKLLIHTDVVSPHSHTVRALTPFLSRPSGTLVAQLRRHGFNTYWFSSQNEYGVWDNPISLIAKQAHVYKFIRPSVGTYYRPGYYDESLLPLLENSMKDPASPKVVVLHLYSTHAPYCIVIPTEYRNIFNGYDGLGPQFFGDAPDRSSDVNCYDNAIRYVDSLLKQVVHLMDRSLEPSILLYFSDHGEAPGYGTGHIWERHSAYQVEVPGIWYFNHSAENVFSEQIKTLRSRLARPLVTSELKYALLQLVGSLPEGENSKSLFSKRMSPITSRELLYGRVHYDDLVRDEKDYLEITRNNLLELRRNNSNKWKKIWAHRVNSLGKLLEAKEYFSGVELDVVYSSAQKKFLVFHPPARDIGLSLERVLDALSDTPSIGIWMDWKNPEEDTLQESFALLRLLDDKYSIKKRMIIETPPHVRFPALKTLSSIVDIHSYYLPTDSIRDCLRVNSTCQDLARSISTAATSMGAQAISFDQKLYAFVQANQSLLKSYLWLSWDLDIRTDDYAFNSRLKHDSRIEKTLVTFPSIFGR
ncbi:MAG: sulfatase-like hydrolase/transferase [Deltaproteobacteria bacterium]|nr:sulfatase-like hydrolase/transferase [Deltaproteobacteria bacterium]